MNTCVVGLMYGDEGKGAIVDYLAQQYQYVVRYNGGANAGHTVIADNQTFKCHLLPSGVVRRKMCVLTHGMAINPVQLHQEIRASNHPFIYVSKHAHCVMPWHIKTDQSTGISIGTTNKGIGPCYAEKMNRKDAVRLEDLSSYIKENTDRFEQQELAQYSKAADFLKSYFCDTSRLLREAVNRSDNILFESANGMLLDIDFGTFPYVTSSAVGPAAIPQAAGLPNLKLDRIIGVIKSYMTRVGEGPFPTELNNEIGEEIRKRGNEYGTTTGRPRRCGWLDLDLVQQSVYNSGATEIALMHTDVLAGFKTIQYKAGDQLREIYGWNSINDAEFEEYKRLISDFLKKPVTIVSNGPDRNQKVLY